MTWREPLLLVLHVAFGFLALGYVAIAAAALGWLPPPAAAEAAVFIWTDQNGRTLREERPLPV